MEAREIVANRRVFLFRGMAGAAAFLCSTRRSAERELANTPSCVMTSEQETGPYYLDLERVRQDVTEGKQGLRLNLRVTVVDGRRCTPIQNAALDIWHCDASGIYSGFTAAGAGGTPGMPPPGGLPRPFGDPPRNFDPLQAPMPPTGLRNRKHDNTTYLRGVQLTDSEGVVEFKTIYPGWYAGRDIHIHMRIHVGGSATDAKYSGGHVAYTGQLFFPEDVSDAVGKMQPYANRDTERTRQDEDHVFTNQHGAGSIVKLAQLNNKDLDGGLLATAVVGIDPSASTKNIGR